MTAKELRQKYLDFFERNDHIIIPSASLVPSDEEQLEGKGKVLFTSAGMQPLIPYLMGKPHPKGSKLANVQKCLRTDDIGEVGDPTHHTFFEMLGNWSLGDYWKDEAIRLSFDFLTKEIGIPIEKLAVTVFTGDEESAKEWSKQGIPSDRIFYCGKESNWWPTNPSATGPCGPDTEMFYWTGDSEPEGKPNENPLWVEIWNDVFMQFNKEEDGTLEELPQRNVDTGMGLERTVAVLNDKKTSYETDLFLPIIEQICQDLGVEYEDHRDSIRIIADHLKASVFLLKDGIVPGNKMQGYILRRLLRRATAKAFLINKDFGRKSFRILVSRVVDIYPIYLKQEDTEYIEREISLEVGKFRKTIENGFIEYAKMGNKISGSEGFLLLQSFGFPIELVEELAKQDGKTVDREGFDSEFKKHQEASRS